MQQSHPNSAQQDVHLPTGLSHSISWYFNELGDRPEASGKEMLELVLYGLSISVLITLYMIHKQLSKSEAIQRKVRAAVRVKRFFFRRGNAARKHGNSPGQAGSTDSDTETYSDSFAVCSALRAEGMRQCKIVVGIDFTASNEWQGRETCGRKSLHALGLPKGGNHYQRVLSSFSGPLSELAGTQPISGFGFGGPNCRVFPLSAPHINCAEVSKKADFATFRSVLRAYEATAHNMELGGRTSYALMIRHVARMAQRSGQYHVLLLIGDCQITAEKEVRDTEAAIIEASQQPVSIIVIGVGDGPFGIMTRFDDEVALSARRAFDNVRFVKFHQVAGSGGKGKSGPDAAVALAGMLELPEQYRAIKSLGYLKFQEVVTSVMASVMKAVLHKPRVKAEDTKERSAQELKIVETDKGLRAVAL